MGGVVVVTIDGICGVFTHCWCFFFLSFVSILLDGDWL